MDFVDNKLSRYSYVKDSAQKPLYPIVGLGVASFFIFTGYELIRSPSNVLVQNYYGVDQLPLILSFIPLCVVSLLFGYGYFLSRLGPRLTLLLTTLGSSALIVACYFALLAKIKIASAVLFVFGQSYIVLLVEQYWSFVDSYIDEGQAKKWNSIYNGIGSLGAIAGGQIVHLFTKDTGANGLFIVAAITFIPAMLFADRSYKKGQKLLKAPQVPKLPKNNLSLIEQINHHLGLKLFKTSPILVGILSLVVLSQMVSTIFGLCFQNEMQKHFGQNAEAQIAYSGQFYSQMSLLTTVTQFLIAPTILTYIPKKVVMTLIPIINLISSILILVSPNLKLVATVFLIYKCLDYSFFRATKEMLYIPLSFDARYRAKEIIDVVGYRGAKGGTSLFITILQRLSWINPTLYASLATLACIGWVICIWPILRVPHLKAK